MTTHLSATKHGLANTRVCASLGAPVGGGGYFRPSPSSPRARPRFALISQQPALQARIGHNHSGRIIHVRGGGGGIPAGSRSGAGALAAMDLFAEHMTEYLRERLAQL